MSSHHFVKEGQEPSVWVLGTEFSEDILGTLLEWSPMVVASVSAAEKLLSFQIKIDKILTENEDRNSREFYSSLYPVEWIQVADITGYLILYIERYSSHLYLTGLKTATLQEVLFRIPNRLKPFLIGITLTEKWVCPPARWNKWMAKNQTFRLTGKISDWTIKGDFSQKDGIYFSQKDQLFQFENPFQECFIEHLHTHQG